MRNDEMMELHWNLMHGHCFKLEDVESSWITNNSKTGNSKMKQLTAIFSAIILLAAVQNLYADCVQTNNTVSMLGMDSANGDVYVKISGGDGGCSCIDFRFLKNGNGTDPGVDTSMAMSVLLTARETNQKVRIAAHDAGTGGSCNTAFRVYLQ